MNFYKKNFFWGEKPKKKKLQNLLGDDYKFHPKSVHYINSKSMKKINALKRLRMSSCQHTYDTSTNHKPHFFPLQNEKRKSKFKVKTSRSIQNQRRNLINGSPQRKIITGHQVQKSQKSHQKILAKQTWFQHSAWLGKQNTRNQPKSKAKTKTTTKTKTKTRES